MPRPPVTHLISDTHFNHDKIATYCDRPDNFTDLIIKNCKLQVMPQDLVIHIGDVLIGNRRKIDEIMAELPGKWILVRGNHDWCHSCDWWMKHGFVFACDALIYRETFITHKPAKELPDGCQWNVHGHLHNIWHGFHPEGGPELEDKQYCKTSLKYPWQRLFAVEYTNYAPVEFNHFLSHPDKYYARGLNGKTKG